MPKYAKKKKKQKKSKLVPVMLTLILILVVLLAALVLLMPGAEADVPVDDPTTVATEPLETQGEETAETDQPAETTLPAEAETEPAVTEDIPAATEATEAKQFPLVLQDGLQINSVNKYAGIFMEDGSDEVVSGILMIELENTSDQDLHLAQIRLHYADVTAEFQVTNLPAHRKVVLLELNRTAYIAEMPESAEAVNVAFVEKFSMYEDKLEIKALSGVINVRNISGEDITEDIYVYYKNTAGDTYYGGITYRIRIEGGLKKDEIRQMMASHFDEDTCQLLMVTIGG